MNYSHTMLFKKIIAICAVLVLASPLFVHAQAGNQGYTMLEPLPCIPSLDAQGNPVPGGVTCPNGTAAPLTTIDFKTYVQYTFNLFIALAAVAAVFMMVWGGFEYMNSESIYKKGDGLNKFKNAIIGLILVLCSYLILRTINPALVDIPNTLVPNLNSLATSTRTLNDYNSLEQQVGDYTSVNSTDTRTELQRAQNEERARQQERAALAAQLNELQNNNVPADDPRSRTIQAQIANIDNQISDARAANQVSVATLGFQNAVAQAQQAVQANGNAAASRYARIVNTLYEQNAPYLQSNPEQLIRLMNARDAALAEIATAAGYTVTNNTTSQPGVGVNVNINANSSGVTGNGSAASSNGSAGTSGPYSTSGTTGTKKNNNAKNGQNKQLNDALNIMFFGPVGASVKQWTGFSFDFNFF